MKKRVEKIEKIVIFISLKKLVGHCVTYVLHSDWLIFHTGQTGFSSLHKHAVLADYQCNFLDCFCTNFGCILRKKRENVNKTNEKMATVRKL